MSKGRKSCGCNMLYVTGEFILYRAERGEKHERRISLERGERRNVG